MNIQRKNSAHHFRMQSEREQTLVWSKAIKPRLKDSSFMWYKQNKIENRVAKDYAALKSRLLVANRS